MRTSTGETEMSSSDLTYDECAPGGFAPDSEGRLVAAAARGDVAAFEALALRYKRIVMAIMRRMSGNILEEEDLTQQAFMKAFANVSRFGGRSSFSTWLISIAINEALMGLRKARRSREVTMSELMREDELDAPLDFIDSDPSPEANCTQRECLSMLSAELARLKPGIRDVLQLCDLDEKSVVEASRVLGVTVSGVKSRRFRGRAILRARLKARFTLPQRRTGGSRFERCDPMASCKRQAAGNPEKDLRGNASGDRLFMVLSRSLWRAKRNPPREGGARRIP
jgi:RNA polymerase sigma-70 factor, ECF subfamily